MPKKTENCHLRHRSAPVGRLQYTIQTPHRVSTNRTCVGNRTISFPISLSFQASVLYPMSTAHKLLASTSADLDRISTRVMDIPLSRKTHFHRNVVDLDPFLACSVDREAALLDVLTRCEGTRMYDAMEDGKDLKKVDTNKTFRRNCVVSLWSLPLKAAIRGNASRPFNSRYGIWPNCPTYHTESCVPVP